MGDAYKCDITGALVAGVPVRQFSVSLGGDVELRCQVMTVATRDRRKAPLCRKMGALSPEAVAWIKECFEKAIKDESARPIKTPVAGK